MTHARPICIAASLVAAFAVAAPVAAAKDGHGLRVHGTCSRASDIELKLSREDGGTEVELEVDQNRNRVRWNVTLRRSGARILAATRTTRAPSGSFSIRRVVSGSAGTFVAVATRAGERCTVRASL